MKRLTDKKYWDDIYIPMKEKKSSGIFSNLKDKIKNLSRDYNNFLIWEIILPKFIKKDKYKNVLEVGCAPGKYLYKMHELFGLNPFGVEYSQTGVDVTKKFFNQKGVNEENVIFADFFDDLFLEKYKESFDVVFSRGFIEHFENPKDVVSRHFDLLKKGGVLFIQIPNLSGVNYFLAKILNIDSFNLHNISIMNKDKFGNLFDKNLLDFYYCDYLGFFSFGLFNTNTKFKYLIYRALLIVQRFFDLFFRLFFVLGVDLKSKFTSPYLLFVGRKK